MDQNTTSMVAHSQPTHGTSSALLWALLFGNFVIGCGIMVVPSNLTYISADLDQSIPITGQLITAGAVLMGLCAPLLAALVSKWDRRRLLTYTMAWYGVFHLLCAFAPNFSWLLPLRVLAVITPAIFTPQAAACVGLLASPESRGKAITFIFLGWSIASVFGVPVLTSIGGYLGWRWAFGFVALLGLISSLWVWLVLPNGIQIVALSRAAWKGVLQNRVLMMTVGVTLLSSFAQFVLFAYLTAYYQEILQANTGTTSLFFLWFGFCGLVGSLLVARYIDRIGAERTPVIAMSLMALSLLVWPLGVNVFTMMLVCIPWGLGCFASNSAQQVRLAHIAPLMAGASIALNTSAMYGGQAFGSALGGWLIAHGQLTQLHWFGFAIMLCAIALSAMATRQKMAQQ